ncbi:MAG: amidohydrolase family protein [Acidobacteria bacterium]|nr:amidohydrolase family protein [Acidobacteriota bacterium]
MDYVRSIFQVPALAVLAAGGLASQPIVLTGARLFDGTGAAPLDNAAVLINGNRIERTGRVGSFAVPDGARRIDVTGKTVIPGLIDHHFHLDTRVVPLFLRNGITSLRDPGKWIESYEPVRRWQRVHGVAGPRLFYCGPLLDGTNPAYPEDSIALQSPLEARVAVRRLVAEGASAVKVYFRLPLDSVRAVVEEAHQHRIPVTAHLEIVDVRDAVEAGVDGIEHVTSLGPALLTHKESERYRQQVLADSAARGMGRYRMWAAIDPFSARAVDLARTLARRRTYVDPTLAIFEKQANPQEPESAMMVRATRNMIAYTGVLHKQGVPIVVGSHTSVPYAKAGFAYHRELELLVEAGLTPAEALTAATLTGAQFLGRQHDLGTIEPGKLADLVVLDADPLANIGNARRVSLVLVDGRVVESALPAVTTDPGGERSHQ